MRYARLISAMILVSVYRMIVATLDENLLRPYLFELVKKIITKIIKDYLWWRFSLTGDIERLQKKKKVITGSRISSRIPSGFIQDL